MKNKNINWMAVGALLVLPAFVVALVLFYYSVFGIGWFEFSLVLVGYYISNIAVGVGFHRLWSHSSFKAGKVLEFVLVLLTAGTLQGPIIAWVSDHRRHHAFTDKEGDPHSPYFGMNNKFLGFLWSHIGWMIFGKNGLKIKNLDKLTVKKFEKDKLVKWQWSYYWPLSIFMNIVPPALIGFCCAGTQGIFAGIIFMGLGRAIQQQATFCINSVTHFFGSRVYTDGTAGDIWWMAPFLLGENYHNFHHAFSQDYRNGHKWYHLDAHKWIIYLLKKVGLASDLIITPDDVIERRKSEVLNIISASFVKKLQSAELSASRLARAVRERIDGLEKSATTVVDNFNEKLLYLENSALYIAELAGKLTVEADSLTEKAVKNVLKQLRALEKFARDSLHLVLSDFENKQQLQ